MTRHEAEQQLQRIFGFPKFYDDQWATIERILKGERILLIEKTGYGKSLCFQFPATQFDGLTIVFSPLIALMRDQLKRLNELGIPARCINSGQEQEENEAILREATAGKLKLLYIAPERQDNDAWIEATRAMNLSMVVIDEAHCISVWGHDFRPAFRRIINLVKLLPAGFPVLATTATATKRVEDDIVRQMGEHTVSIRGQLERPNFHLRVVKVESEDEKLAWLGKNIDKLPGTGIIYTGTRINTDLYSRWLQSLGIAAVAYNAGLESALRKEIEDGLIANRWKAVVATNALGMGIDKPDIRFIVHTQMPASLVHYYQEIGRAGRDGLPTHLLLFFQPDDTALPIAFIESARPDESKYERVITLLKKAPHGEMEIARETNLTRNQVRTINTDLIEQRIIHEVKLGRSKKFEYRYGAPPLNTAQFEALRKAKWVDLDHMVDYIDSDACRMKLLCTYLGDKHPAKCGQCDNDLGRFVRATMDTEWRAKLDAFHGEDFPVLKVGHSRTKLMDGVAGSYYGISNVGAAIHRCKYEDGGDFPDSLLDLTLNAFHHQFGVMPFDLLLYVPPTESGDLVRRFADKIAVRTGIHLSHGLKKIHKTTPQKVIQGGASKSANVAGAFAWHGPGGIAGKTVLLLDDVFDSGATIKEIGKLLGKLGAACIAPLVIAKTVGGDLSGNQ